jgi:hypothetical protein
MNPLKIFVQHSLSLPDPSTANSNFLSVFLNCDIKVLPSQTVHAPTNAAFRCRIRDRIGGFAAGRNGE